MLLQRIASEFKFYVNYTNIKINFYGRYLFTHISPAHNSTPNSDYWSIGTTQFFTPAAGTQNHESNLDDHIWNPVVIEKDMEGVVHLLKGNQGRVTTHCPLGCSTTDRGTNYPKHKV